MKKQVSPLVFIIAIVVVVGIAGAFGYRALNPKHDLQVNSSETARRMVQMQQNQSGDPSKHPKDGGGQGPTNGRGGYPSGYGR